MPRPLGETPTTNGVAKDQVCLFIVHYSYLLQAHKTLGGIKVVMHALKSQHHGLSWKIHQMVANFVLCLGLLGQDHQRGNFSWPPKIRFSEPAPSI